MKRIVCVTLKLFLLPFVGSARGADFPSSAKAINEGELWWHRMFSIAFDGHGNFVTPHLDALHTTAASLGAGGYHGVWDADLNRDMPWMRGHEQAFADHPKTKRVVYIEGNRSEQVLARLSADGRVLFTSPLLNDLRDPKRIQYIKSLITPGGRTVWFGDWTFMQSPELKTPLGRALPTAKSLGLPAFTHPLDGSPITSEADFWRTRSASALIGERNEAFEKYASLPNDMAGAPGLFVLKSDFLVDELFCQHRISAKPLTPCG